MALLEMNPDAWERCNMRGPRICHAGQARLDITKTVERLRISGLLGYKHYFSQLLAEFLMDKGVLPPVGILALDPLATPSKGRPRDPRGDTVLVMKEAGLTLLEIAGYIYPEESSRKADLIDKNRLANKVSQLGKTATQKRDEINSSNGMALINAIRIYLEETHRAWESEGGGGHATHRDGGETNDRLHSDKLADLRTLVFLTRSFYEEGARRALAEGLVRRAGYRVNIAEGASSMDK